MTHSIETHYHDDQGRPSGGTSAGIGYTIAWQRGPCPTPDARNGAFLIEVLESCRERLNFYQSGEFSCAENEEALDHVKAAVFILKARRDRRREAGTLGTHAKDAAG